MFAELIESRMESHEHVESRMENYKRVGSRMEYYECVGSRMESHKRVTDIGQLLPPRPQSPSSTVPPAVKIH